MQVIRGVNTLQREGETQWMLEVLCQAVLRLHVHLIKTLFNFITWLQMLFVSMEQTLHLHRTCTIFQE